LDYSAIIFSKNDDYLKVKDENMTNIVLKMSDIIIMELEIERQGNFEIK
jgi:hypothetical protein